jgi:hypothetical protein
VNREKHRSIRFGDVMSFDEKIELELRIVSASDEFDEIKRIRKRDFMVSRIPELKNLEWQYLTARIAKAKKIVAEVKGTMFDPKMIDRSQL